MNSSTRNHINIFLPLILIFFLSACGTRSSHESSEAAHEHHDDHSGIVITEHEAWEFNIKTNKVEATPFAEVIKVSGRIEPAPTDMQTITARKSGIVTLAPGIRQGSEVTKGTLIATISSRGMQGGDVNAASRATLEATRKEYERLKPLYEEGLVTAGQFNAAEQAYNEARAMASEAPKGGSQSETAPANGVLSEIFVNTGQYVEAGTPIGVVTGNSVLTLRADVPQRYASRLSNITDANFRQDHTDEIYTISALKGKKITASIPAPEKGYLPVRFSFTGNGRILPGSFTEVYLTGTPKENVIVLPKEAFLEIQGNKYVYVKDDDGDYEKRKVMLGASDGRNIEVKEGLETGEEVVVSGASVVRMIETSRIAPPQHTHNH